MTRTLLAVETSCDETCAAVVQGRMVISNVVASQAAQHEPFGGIVPEIASRRHLELLDAVVARALEQAEGVDVEAIAVTQGPGLIGALLVGVANAKARAYATGLPLVAVDHLSGHVASALIADPTLEPPFMCLLVSGGHTLLLDVGPHLDMRLLGTTRDDAAGEAFDKGARLLGLEGAGGPAVEQCAATGDPARHPFTPAMVHHDTLDTSFAGLKTALAVHLKSRGGAAALEAQELSDIAACYQQAICATLLASVRKAFRAKRPARCAVVGGVAANSELRAQLQQLCSENDVQLTTVPLKYCGDNAAMIGAAAAFHADLLPDEALALDAYSTSPLLRKGEYVPKQPR